MTDHYCPFRFGVLEGQEVFDAAEIKEQTGKKQKVQQLRCLLPPSVALALHSTLRSLVTQCSTRNEYQLDKTVYNTAK